ncbi:MAG: rhomboid family intramembrane serine protease [Deltaproteobacteria bacterium]|nr:rhomboid family intramembrane serine protease [Deltaproteobacteria bacterium]
MTMTPMVLRLLIAMAVIGILFMILGQTDSGHVLAEYLLLTPTDAVFKGRVWQVATYMWVHVAPLQLLLNMLFLWFFGPQFEARWGPRSFIRFVVLAGIGSGIVATLVGIVMPFFNVADSGIGGALNALLMAFALAFPEATINFYFLIPVKAKQLIYIVVLVEVVFAAAGMNHQLPGQLGGLLSGWLLITGKWRPSRWGIGGKQGGRPKRPNPGNLRVVKGGGDEDDDDEEKPPKYLN